MERLLAVSSSPHIHHPVDTQKIMKWVLIALIPAGLVGVFVFGPRALAVMAVCVASAVASEYMWQRCAKQPSTVSDCSAAVTGLLLAYNLPPTIPFWMASVGSVFAIVVVKQLFGGIGCNIVNPALAARVMMLSSWPAPMTTWVFDGVTSATPLAMIKEGAAAKAGVLAGSPPLVDLILGNIGGCIGETSVLALAIGFAILLWREVIEWHIPVIYIVTVAVLSIIFCRQVSPVYDICSGGLFLGAIFMATDYTTSPMTVKGRVIFALGCGILTSLIRAFGNYPEGVSFSILIMNLTVPLIDKMIRPHIFGEVKSRD